MKPYIYETMLQMDEEDEFDTSCEFVIFAESRIRSAQLLVGFQLIYRALPDTWHPYIWENWETYGIKEQLTRVLAAGVEGLGIFDPVRGWEIIPWPEKKYGRILQPHLRIV